MQIKEISATKLPDIGIKRVAAYARVSSDKEAAIHSLSSQISYYNEYISKRFCNNKQIPEAILISKTSLL